MAATETLRGASMDDLMFLDTLQANTFRWFWDTTDSATGLVPDRWPTQNFSSVAAIGFGLGAYGVGAERGFVSRADAAERTLTTLRFLWRAPQGPDQTGMTGFKGYFYHFLNADGSRFRDVELSSIDTALLMGGVLFAQGYFDRDTPAEAGIRAYADSLYQRVEWDFFQTQSPLQTMAWRPGVGYGKAEYQGYNEAMLLYVLALGSPTFPAQGQVWDDYTSTYIWGDFYGQEHLNFSPLFGHQYSQTFVDFRGIQDAFMRSKSASTGAPVDYFENSRRATYAQQAYARANPLGWSDYSSTIWGLTACDGPADVRKTFNGQERLFQTYSARGASLEYVGDDGTIAPTAAGGSLAFAPEIALPGAASDADPLRQPPLHRVRLPRRLQPVVHLHRHAGQARVGRDRYGVVRPRLPGHRPGANPAHGGECALGPRVERDAEEPGHPARPPSRRLHGRMAGIGLGDGRPARRRPRAGSPTRRPTCARPSS